MNAAHWMTQRELSKLSFLISAIVKDYRDYRQILELLKSSALCPPSKEFKRAIGIIRKTCRSCTSEKLLFRRATKLAASRDYVESRVGKSMTWWMRGKQSW